MTISQFKGSYQGLLDCVLNKNDIQAFGKK